jgi:hypothetical protein
MAAAPESDSSPTSSPALVLAVVPVLVTHPRSMTSRPLPASGPFARRLGCRRRALDDCEENPHSYASEGRGLLVRAVRAASEWTARISQKTVGYG